MPPKKSKASIKMDENYEESDDYKKKRARNNLAVKKSREQSKKKTKETKVRVTHLKVKNKVLQDKIGLLKKNLSFLKNLFITQAASKQDKLSQEEINDILKEVGDTDDEELNEKPGASSPTYSDDSD